MMNHDAVHYTALHNTQPRTILNLTGTTLCNLGNSLAQSWHLVCTIWAPRWHNLGTSLAQSWHLVQHLCTTLHNTEPCRQPITICIHCCVQLQAGRHLPPHPDNESGTKIDLGNKQQVEVSVTRVNEGAGVVRSGSDLVKILRLLPICQQCLFK